MLSPHESATAIVSVLLDQCNGISLGECLALALPGLVLDFHSSCFSLLLGKRVVMKFLRAISTVVCHFCHYMACCDHVLKVKK